MPESIDMVHDYSVFLTKVLAPLMCRSVGEFHGRYGNTIVAEVSSDDVDGGLRVPILRSYIPPTNIEAGIDAMTTPHYVDRKKGFHLAGVPIHDWVIDSHSIEDTWGTMFAGRKISAPQVRWLEKKFKERRRATISSEGYGQAIQVLRTFRPKARNEVISFGDAILAAMSCFNRFSHHAEHTRQDTIHAFPIERRLDDAINLQVQLGLIIPAAFHLLSTDENSNPLEPKPDSNTVDAFIDCLGVDNSAPSRLALQKALTALFSLMCYHGVGNVSTEAAVIAASGNASMYEVFSSMVGGLAGVNHGNAAMMGITQLLRLRKEFGANADYDTLFDCAHTRLKYLKMPLWCGGHGLLDGEEDPRNTVIAKIIEQVLEQLFELNNGKSEERMFYNFAQLWYKAVVAALKEADQAVFQAINVDGLTGLLLHICGLIPEENMASFALAIFAWSRSCGASAEAFWAAASRRKQIPGLIRAREASWEVTRARKQVAKTG